MRFMLVFLYFTAFIIPLILTKHIGDDYLQNEKRTAQQNLEEAKNNTGRLVQPNDGDYADKTLSTVKSKPDLRKDDSGKVSFGAMADVTSDPSTTGHRVKERVPDALAASHSEPTGHRPPRSKRRYKLSNDGSDNHQSIYFSQGNNQIICSSCKEVPISPVVIVQDLSRSESEDERVQDFEEKYEIHPICPTTNEDVSESFSSSSLSFASTTEETDASYSPLKKTIYFKPVRVLESNSGQMESSQEKCMGGNTERKYWMKKKYHVPKKTQTYSSIRDCPPHERPQGHEATEEDRNAHFPSYAHSPHSSMTDVYGDKLLKHITHTELQTEMITSENIPEENFRSNFEDISLASPDLDEYSTTDQGPYDLVEDSSSDSFFNEDTQFKNDPNSNNLPTKKNLLDTSTDNEENVRHVLMPPVLQQGQKLKEGGIYYKPLIYAPESENSFSNDYTPLNTSEERNPDYFELEPNSNPTFVNAYDEPSEEKVEDETSNKNSDFKEEYPDIIILQNPKQWTPNDRVPAELNSNSENTSLVQKEEAIGPNTTLTRSEKAATLELQSQTPPSDKISVTNESIKKRNQTRKLPILNLEKQPPVKRNNATGSNKTLVQNETPVNITSQVESPNENPQANPDQESPKLNSMKKSVVPSNDKIKQNKTKTRPDTSSQSQAPVQNVNVNTPDVELPQIQNPRTTISENKSEIHTTVIVGPNTVVSQNIQLPPIKPLNQTSVQKKSLMGANITPNKTFPILSSQNQDPLSTSDKNGTQQKRPQGTESPELPSNDFTKISLRPVRPNIVPSESLKPKKKPLDDTNIPEINLKNIQENVNVPEGGVIIINEKGAKFRVDKVYPENATPIKKPINNKEKSTDIHIFNVSNSKDLPHSQNIKLKSIGGANKQSPQGDLVVVLISPTQSEPSNLPPHSRVLNSWPGQSEPQLQTPYQTSRRRKLPQSTPSNTGQTPPQPYQQWTSQPQVINLKTDPLPFWVQLPNQPQTFNKFNQPISILPHQYQPQYIHKGFVGQIPSVSPNLPILTNELPLETIILPPINPEFYSRPYLLSLKDQLQLSREIPTSISSPPYQTQPFLTVQKFAKEKLNQTNPSNVQPKIGSSKSEPIQPPTQNQQASQKSSQENYPKLRTLLLASPPQDVLTQLGDRRSSLVLPTQSYIPYMQDNYMYSVPTKPIPNAYSQFMQTYPYGKRNRLPTTYDNTIPSYVPQEPITPYLQYWQNTANANCNLL